MVEWGRWRRGLKGGLGSVVCRRKEGKKKTAQTMQNDESAREMWRLKFEQIIASNESH